MKKRLLILTLFAFIFTSIAAYSMNGTYSSRNTGVVVEQINYPRGSRTVQTRYNNSTSNSLNSTRRSIGYSPTTKARGASYGMPAGYYNQPVYIPATYTPVTTTRRYNIGGNGYSNVYTEQTTRYYGNPSIRTYPAGSGMNNPNRYLNW